MRYSLKNQINTLKMRLLFTVLQTSYEIRECAFMTDILLLSPSEKRTETRAHR